MSGVVIFAIMMIGAFIPFALVGYWVRMGKNGYALTLVALAGGLFTIFVYGADGRLGLDPLMALSWAMIFLFPALIGCAAGGLLGWLLRRRDLR